MKLKRRNILGCLIAAFRNTRHGCSRQPEAVVRNDWEDECRARETRGVDRFVIASGKTIPGCLSYIVAEDDSDAEGIWITEVWDSKESHDASLSLPAVKKAVTAARLSSLASVRKWSQHL